MTVTVTAIFGAAATDPSRPALIFNDHELSYAAFAGAIAAARDRLVAWEIEGGGVAILAMNNLLDAWTFGIAARAHGLTTFITRVVEDVDVAEVGDVRCVIVSAIDPWPGLEAACVRRGWRMMVAEPLVPSENLRPPVAAYGGHILQTSGTTGAYKLVLLDDPVGEERELRARQALFGLTADSHIALADFGGWTGIGYKSACATWLVGGAVVISQGRGPGHVLSRPELTHAHLIPQILFDILAAPGPGVPFNPGLGVIVTGGPIGQSLADEVKARIAPRLYNSVAATESTVFAFTALEGPEDSRWHRPAPGVVLELVDEREHPVAVGQIGRLRLATAGGPTAYLGDAAASAGFFKPGWFYPGDLAVFRDDGRFALHGRATDVINARGHKIAPAPHEEALCERLGVTGVCIFSIQDGAAEEQLYVVIEAPAPLDLNLVTAILRERMQGFDRAHVHYLRALPRNELGKVQRMAVQAMVVGERITLSG